MPNGQLTPEQLARIRAAWDTLSPQVQAQLRTAHPELREPSTLRQGLAQLGMPQHAAAAPVSTAVGIQAMPSLPTVAPGPPMGLGERAKVEATLGFAPFASLFNPEYWKKERERAHQRKAEAPPPRDLASAALGFISRIGGETPAFAASMLVGGTAAAPLKARPLLHRMAEGAATFGTFGAVQEPEHRLESAAFGAGLGALLGAGTRVPGAIRGRLQRKAAQRAGMEAAAQQPSPTLERIIAQHEAARPAAEAEALATRIAERRRFDSLIRQAEQMEAEGQLRLGTAQEMRQQLGRELGIDPAARLVGDEGVVNLERLPVVEELATRPPGVVAPRGGKPQEILNFSRYVLNPNSEKLLEERITATLERGGIVERTVTWQETRREAAKATGLPLDEITAEPLVGEARGRVLAMADIINQNTATSVELSRRLATEPLLDAEREMALRLIEGLNAEIDYLLPRVTGTVSEAARIMNAQRIATSHSMEPAVWFMRAQRVLARGGKGVQDKHRAEIIRLIGAKDKEGLAKYVADLYKPSFGEMGATLWKAGLLTLPPTYMANIMGNTSMAILETAKDPVALIFDRLIGVATGLETKAPTFQSLLAAPWSGAKYGFKEFRQIMGGRSFAAGAKRFDYYREVNFNNVLFDAHKLIFRFLAAFDRPFYGMALERSLTERATLLARAEGLRGRELATRVRGIVDAARERAVGSGPITDEIALGAIADAEYAVFLNQGRLGNMARSIKRYGGTPTEFILPFTMTPANIASRVAEYSPFGALSTIPDAVRLAVQVLSKSKVPEAALQKKIVERLARSTTGATPIAIGYLLAQNGLMTGHYPLGDPRKRAAWALEGKHENAILIGDKWYSVERISPIGNLLAWGAGLYDIVSSELPWASKLALMAAEVPRSVVEQSFLTGIRDLMQLAENPKAEMNDYLEGLIGSVIPTIVRKIAYGIDPVVREAELRGVQPFQQRVPGATTGLPPRIDVFGKPVERLPGMIRALFDPFSARADVTQQDPIVREIAAVDAAIMPLSKRKGERDAQYRLRQVKYGEKLYAALEALFQTPEYRGIAIGAQITARKEGVDAKELENEWKRHIIQRAVTDTRRMWTDIFDREGP